MMTLFGLLVFVAGTVFFVISYLMDKKSLNKISDDELQKFRERTEENLQRSYRVDKGFLYKKNTVKTQSWKKIFNNFDEPINLNHSIRNSMFADFLDSYTTFQSPKYGKVYGQGEHAKSNMAELNKNKVAVELLGEYSAKYFLGSLDEIFYNNIFEDSELKKLYNDAFMGALNKEIEKKAFQDAEKNVSSSDFLYHHLTKKMYQESYVKGKSAIEENKNENREQLEALVALTDDNVSAYEFEEHFMKDWSSPKMFN